MDGNIKIKGNRGKSQRVQCDSCGALIPRNKSIRVRKHALPIDRNLYDTLRKMNASIHIGMVIVLYCLSCAKHRKVI